MQIVIDISQEIITDIKENYEGYNVLYCAVKNGTPLPKGHGALIDISNIDVIELEDSNHIIRHIKGDEVDAYISAPIIIEADAERDKE